MIYMAKIWKNLTMLEFFYSIANKFNFNTIQTPIIENQELFLGLLESLQILFQRKCIHSLIKMNQYYA